jgi:UDP-N-acetylmuramate dehydrogenase
MLAREDVPLAPLTTLRLGGPAARMVEIQSEDDVMLAVRDADARGEPLLVLGGGSNIVVADAGFPGLVANMAIRGIDVRKDGQRVVVDVAAGEDWDPLAAHAVDEGWSGFECMSGIPGRVGATPIQNVGAYGQEVSDTVAWVRAFDREDQAFVTLEASACGFGYRTSLFKRESRWIVTRVRFVLEAGREAPVRYAELARVLSLPRGARAPSRTVRDTVLELRQSKGMVLDPSDPDSVSAGSFFVNPILDAQAFAELERRAGERPPCFEVGDGRAKVPAAWLVERAGFPKGWGHGAVGVSRKHALALVNRGGATTRELLALARAICEGVRARFGVELEPEPVFVGCSWQ